MGNFPPPTATVSAIFLTLFCSHFSLARSQSFIGVNYGEVADNLPPPSATAKLLQSATIEKVRLYGTDPNVIKALADTGIGIVIGAANSDIPALAADPSFAMNWIKTNVIPFYPASNIILISVGNEVMSSGDQGLINQLLSAMQNMQNALTSASLGGKIKVSTVHSMAVISQSEPPSSGSFDPALTNVLKGILAFNNATGSPFAINPYPYFAYQSDPRPDTLAFCLFQPNAGRLDSNTNIKYMNMFDAQVDVVHSALNALGFNDVEIVVGETGWPYKGDANEVGPSAENAEAYNGNLIQHLRSMVGTPLMPEKSVDAYLFALYEEYLKTGPSSERSFGLFQPDLTMTYDVGLSKGSQQAQSPEKTASPERAASPENTTSPEKTSPAPADPSSMPSKAAGYVPNKEDRIQNGKQTWSLFAGMVLIVMQSNLLNFALNRILSHSMGGYALDLLYPKATLSSKSPSIPF